MLALCACEPEEGTVGYCDAIDLLVLLHEGIRCVVEPAQRTCRGLGSLSVHCLGATEVSERYPRVAVEVNNRAA